MLHTDIFTWSEPMPENKWLYILYDGKVIDGELCKVRTGFTRDFKEALLHLINVRDSMSILGHIVIIHGDHSYFVNTVHEFMGYVMVS